MTNDLISDEDRDLFRQAMRTVEPLNQVKPKAGIERETVKFVRHQAELQSPPSSVEPVYLSSQYSENTHADSLLTYRVASLPIKRFKQLQKGLIPWQARMDLHGLRVDDAADKLRQFIRTQTEIGHRCVLIIHGKGGHHGETPVIKSYTNHWLKQFPEILAFHSALPRDGGTGAVYVLLRRKPKDTHFLSNDH